MRLAGTNGLIPVRRRKRGVRMAAPGLESDSQPYERPGVLHAKRCSEEPDSSAARQAREPLYRWRVTRGSGYNGPINPWRKM